LAILHVVGAAGDVNGRPFDDDGNLFAQVKRLVDTGGLTDRIGYAAARRSSGVLSPSTSLGTIAGDVRFVRMIDALELVLFLGLGVRRGSALENATSAIWAAVVVLLTSALRAPAS